MKTQDRFSYVQSDDLGDKLRVSQAKLAVATKGQVGPEPSTNSKGQHHTGVSHEYGNFMGEYCAEQN